MDFLKDLMFSLPYFAMILVIVPTVGFLVADKVMTPNIDLKSALFHNDNQVAGLEFGAILLMLLYLAYCAVMGDVAGSFASDLGVASGAIVVSILLLAIARAVLGRFVASHNGGADLNNEIFIQKNWAAACVSIAVMIGIVNGMTEEDMLSSTPMRDLLLAGTVMTLGVLVVQLFRVTHLRGRDFMKTFFTDDNPAAGVSLLGFAIAANVIFFEVTKAVKVAEGLSTITSVLAVIGGSLVLLALLSVTRRVLEAVVNRIFDVSIEAEIFEISVESKTYNVGAGFIDACITIGAAVVLTGVLV